MVTLRTTNPGGDGTGPVTAHPNLEGPTVNGIYTAAPQPGELVCICPLPATTTAALTTGRAGSRDYLAGKITVTDTGTAAKILYIDRQAAGIWALWDGTYLRIKSVGLGDGGILEIHVDQSMHGLARHGETGARIGVRLVEPSPPRPAAEWKKAETERALADYFAAQKAGRQI